LTIILLTGRKPLSSVNAANSDPRRHGFSACSLSRIFYFTFYIYYIYINRQKSGLDDVSCIDYETVNIHGRYLDIVYVGFC